MFRIKGCPDQSFLNAEFVVCRFYYLKRKFSQQGQILSGIEFSCTAVILLKGNIKVPVQPILDGPVSSCQATVVSGVGKILVAYIVSCLALFPSVLRDMACVGLLYLITSFISANKPA